jgi:hypothetical protein
MHPVEFYAPWAYRLKVRTFVALGIFATISTFGFFHDVGDRARLWIALTPVVIALLSLLFGVRGYRLTGQGIEIRRFGWSKRLPLAGLRSVEGKAEAMTKSHRIFAKGLFANVGFYWSKELGLVFVYATDFSRAVVLKYERRKYVVTPHDPQHFIVRVRMLLKTAEFPD